MILMDPPNSEHSVIPWIGSLTGAQAQGVLFPHPKTHRDRSRMQTSMFLSCSLQQPEVFESQVPHCFMVPAQICMNLWAVLLPSCPQAPTGRGQTGSPEGTFPSLPSGHHPALFFQQQVDLFSHFCNFLRFMWTHDIPVFLLSVSSFLLLWWHIILVWTLSLLWFPAARKKKKKELLGHSDIALVIHSPSLCLFSLFFHDNSRIN